MGFGSECDQRPGLGQRCPVLLPVAAEFAGVCKDEHLRRLLDHSLLEIRLAGAGLTQSTPCYHPVSADENIVGGQAVKHIHRRRAHRCHAAYTKVAAEQRYAAVRQITQGRCGEQIVGNDMQALSFDQQLRKRGGGRPAIERDRVVIRDMRERTNVRAGTLRARRCEALAIQP